MIFKKGDLVVITKVPYRWYTVEPGLLKNLMAAVWVVRGDRGPNGWIGLEADVDLDGHRTVVYLDPRTLKIR